MSMIYVRYNRKAARPEYRGRDGDDYMEGLRIYASSDSIILRPAGSDGAPGSCQLEIPLHHVDRVIDVLSMLKEDAELENKKQRRGLA